MQAVVGCAIFGSHLRGNRTHQIVVIRCDRIELGLLMADVADASTGQSEVQFGEGQLIRAERESWLASS